MELQKQKISDGVNKPKIILVLILILLAGNVFLGVKYFSVVKELRQDQAALQAQKTGDKVLEFTKLFIEKVLKAKTEVDFETRLRFEAAVRDLEDEEIFAQWQRFIESRTEVVAQEEVKNLLDVLVGKIKIE